MRITVLFFAHLREAISLDRVKLDIEPGATIRELKKILLDEYPTLQAILDRSITSINHEFAQEDDVIPAYAEVAFFPPVSGGGDSQDVVELVYDELHIDPLLNIIVAETTGGVCFFAGVVRQKTERDGARITEKLQYQAYPEMAYGKMHQIVGEIKVRWPKVERVVIIQRLGDLRPGEISVFIACTSSHREEGIFDAVHFGINRLKEIVPIWKKEITDRGDYWVEGDYYPKSSD